MLLIGLFQLLFNVSLIGEKHVFYYTAVIGGVSPRGLSLPGGSVPPRRLSHDSQQLMGTFHHNITLLLNHLHFTKLYVLLIDRFQMILSIWPILVQYI